MCPSSLSFKLWPAVQGQQGSVASQLEHSRDTEIPAVLLKALCGGMFISFSGLNILIRTEVSDSFHLVGNLAGPHEENSIKFYI